MFCCYCSFYLVTYFFLHNFRKKSFYIYFVALIVMFSRLSKGLISLFFFHRVSSDPVTDSPTTNNMLREQYYRGKLRMFLQRILPCSVPQTSGAACGANDDSMILDSYHQSTVTQSHGIRAKRGTSNQKFKSV